MSKYEKLQALTQYTTSSLPIPNLTLESVGKAIAVQHKDLTTQKT